MNEANVIFTVFVLVILIFMIGFFSSSETAYLSLPKIRLRRMISEKKPNSKNVAALKENMDRLLSTVLIGTNFLNSLASALTTALAVKIVGQGGVGIATLVIAFFVTIFGQIIPKTIATIHTEKVASMFSVPLLTIEKIFFPVIWIFERISHLAVLLIEKFIKPSKTIITEEELKTLIDVGENEGTIEKDESQMLSKIIKFNNLEVSDIMKHRSMVSMVCCDATYEEVEKEFLDSGFSTLAVYENSRENVVGVINYKKILTSDKNSECEKGYAKKIMSSVSFVPATMSVLELLNKFRSSRYKFAVVLNEMSDTMGIVTMEDIIRVVFDRMTDENSLDKIPAEQKIRVISPTEFIVQGNLKLDSLNELIHLGLESEDFLTLGGWLLEQFGSLPSVGEVAVRNGVIYTAEDVSKRRIVTVRIKLKTEPETKKNFNVSE